MSTSIDYCSANATSAATTAGIGCGCSHLAQFLLVGVHVSVVQRLRPCSRIAVCSRAAEKHKVNNTLVCRPWWKVAVEVEVAVAV